MSDDLKKLMLAYSRRGMRDWESADAALKKLAMRYLCNSVAERPQDVDFTVNGRFAEPQFIPMPRHKSGDFEWSFFLPKQDAGRLESLLLFILVDRKRCIAFRFECSAGGRHGYSHVQLTSRLRKSGLSVRQEDDDRNGGLPAWLPDSYPAFPVPARDWTEMFLAMVTAVHGYRGGVDDLLRELFSGGTGARDARQFNDVLQKMLCKLN